MSHKNIRARRHPHPNTQLYPKRMSWERPHSPQKKRTELLQPDAVRSLLVPLDGTPYAEHALPHALAIARRSGALLRLVHVHSRLGQPETWPDVRSADENNDRRKREKQQYLQDVANRIARTDSVKVEVSLIENYDTEEAILKVAVNTDMVVMASRRRGLLWRLWSHSVADELRRRLRIPLLLVRGYSFPVDLTGDPIPRNILIPLDGSFDGERILAPSKKVGQLQDAALTLLNVQNPEWKGGILEHTDPPGYLIWVAREVKKAISTVDARIVTTNEPVAAAVASYAGQHGIDLIALATRADGTWKRFLRSSVVDSLIRRTDLPILIMAIEIGHKRPEIMTVVP